MPIPEPHINKPIDNESAFTALQTSKAMSG